MNRIFFSLFSNYLVAFPVFASTYDNREATFILAVIAIPLMVWALFKMREYDRIDREEQAQSINPSIRSSGLRNNKSTFSEFVSALDDFVTNYGSTRSRPQISGLHRGRHNTQQRITVHLNTQQLVFHQIDNWRLSGAFEIHWRPSSPEPLTISMKLYFASNIGETRELLKEETGLHGLKLCFSDFEAELDELNVLRKKNMGRRKDLEGLVNWIDIENADFVAGHQVTIEKISAAIAYASSSRKEVISRQFDISQVLYIGASMKNDGSVVFDNHSWIVGFKGFCHYRKSERTFSTERCLEFTDMFSGESFEWDEVGLLKSYLLRKITESGHS